MPKSPTPGQRRLEMALELYRDREERPKAERRQLLRLWREFVYPLRWYLLLAIVLSLVFSLQSYVWAFTAKIMVDDILRIGRDNAPTEPRHYQWLLWLLIGQASLQAIIIADLWGYNYFITLVGQRVVFNLRKVLHENLQRLPLSFFDRTQTGRLLSIVLDDVSTVQQTIGGTAVQFCNHVGSILVGIVIISVINWKLALIVLLALPFYVFNYRHFRPRLRDTMRASRRATAILYARVEERVTAIKTVKLFGRESAETHKFVMFVGNLSRLVMYRIRLSSWLNAFATTVSSVATGAVLYFGLQAMRQGDMSLGSVMMFYTSAGLLFSPAVALSDLAVQMQQISVVMRRVFDLMEAEPEPPDRPDAIALPRASGHIAFRGVTFAYPNDEHPTVRGVTFTVKAGKRVAVMGPSGGGKSTLLYLLMRFYDPDEGSIELDGHDLRELKLLSLRDRVTLVMQEPVIFSGTVAENIRYGRLEASAAEVRRAAKDADLHQFIQTLPDGYETVVGERGMTLSGGQRQRLALAASFLSQPSVLLLDDTTSALDPVTEARIRKTLDHLMEGRTCFIVTHRVSTALGCDLALVLEDGQVSQFGPPHDLLHREGLFRRIYEQQQRESVDTIA